MTPTVAVPAAPTVRSPPSRPPAPSVERRPAARRHCWVRGVDGAPGPHPALLVEWRRRDAGQWEALVVYAVEDGGAVTLVQQWLVAALVTPAR